MKKPVSMTARNKLGMSALHVAVLANNLEIIEVLLLELKCQPTV
jgi:ankyrin repeat protein